ncbi:MAG: GNAT family N-acetyltransferase [Rhodospirillaceae bacterium]
MFSFGPLPNVGSLVVSPSRQRRGIGTALMAWSEERARSNGAKEIALDTSEGASHLIRWYTALGYREVDIVQWQGKTYRSLILSKTLDGQATA